MFGRKK